MKMKSLTTFVILGLAVAGHAQYGYTPSYPSDNFQKALAQDLLDGLLDQSSYPSLTPTGFRTTYYIRKQVLVTSSAVISNAANTQPLAGQPMTTVAPPFGGRARIIHGVGIRSDMGRWHPVTELYNGNELEEGTPLDPNDPHYDIWAWRFIHASAPVWYVDLDDEVGGTINGGWPETTIGGGGRLFVDPAEESPPPQNTIGEAKANFRPDVVREDLPGKPWTCSLDYGQPTMDLPFVPRHYDAPLTLAKDQVTTSDRSYKWLRATNGAPVNFKLNNIVIPTRTLEYSGTARTAFEFESAVHCTVADFNDLRVVSFPEHEYTSMNTGVYVGPGYVVPNGSGYTLAPKTFILAGNPFSTSASNPQFVYQQRFELMNAPEYLRNPGDMVISYTRHRIYFIPYSQEHISNTADEWAQVLNVSLPETATVDPASQNPSSVYDSPLLIDTTGGFRLQNVDFDACSGSSLRLKRVGAGGTRGMIVDNCGFLNGGISGLRLERCYDSRTVGCTFDHIQGIGYRYTQAVSGEGPEVTFADYREQNDQDHWIFGCTFNKTATMHPAMPAVTLNNRPNHVTIAQTAFTDVSGPAITYSGTNTQILGNTFTRCMPDLAEMGVIYTGRSLTYLGGIIGSNGFTNCSKGSDFGASSNSAFYTEHSCVMLDDAASGAWISSNTFGQMIPYGGTQAPTKEYPMQINGGLFNLVDHNTYPNDGTKIIIGAATVNGFKPGTGAYVVDSSGSSDCPWADLLAGSYCIPGQATWLFGTSPWADNFSTTGAFPTESDYVTYGQDIAGTAGDPAFAWLSGNKIGDLKSYWFASARATRWFAPILGTDLYKLKMSGNVLSHATDVSARLDGEAATSGAFSMAVGPQGPEPAIPIQCPNPAGY